MKAIVSARSGSTAERQLRSPHYSAAALPFMIGERSRRQSATILGKIRALPCKTVHAVDFESVARPGEPAVLSVDSFVLELPDGPVERKAVRRAVGPWVRAAGYDVEEELGQRFMFIRIK